MIDGDDVFEPVTHRDPVGKTMVESFAAMYPAETDRQIYERIERAWRSAGSRAELPMTLDAVTRWRTEAAR